MSAPRLADQPELLTPAQAAALLQISKGTVYVLAAAGDLPSVKLGRLLRIPRAGLAKLLGVTDLGGGDAR